MLDLFRRQPKPTPQPQPGPGDLSVAAPLRWPEQMASEMMRTIASVYREQGIRCRPDPADPFYMSPLFVRFPIERGRDAKSGQRVHVNRASNSNILTELEERLGMLWKRYATQHGGARMVFPAQIVEFRDHPFSVQVPFPASPRPLAWKPDGSDPYSIPLGITFDMSAGTRQVFWNRRVDMHGLISGTTGSGKTVAVQGLLANLMLALPPGELEVVAIDPKNMGLRYLADAPHIRLPVAYEDDDCLRYLAAVDAELTQRVKEQRTTPTLLVAVDEVADILYGNKDAQAWFDRLARKGREMGIYILAGIQKPIVEIMGHGRDQFMFRVVGRMHSASAARAAAGDGVKLSANELVHPGTFYQVTGNAATLTQVYYITPEQQMSVVRKLVQRHGNSRGVESVLAPHLSSSRKRAEEKATHTTAEIAEDRQARAWAEMLEREFGPNWPTAKKVELVQALGHNPGGKSYQAGARKVDAALSALQM